MLQLISENLGACLLAGAGILTGVIILIDLVAGARRKWDPIEVDRGEIVEPKGGRR